MKAPLYRVSQLATANSEIICGGDEDRAKIVEILYPFDDGRYFVRVQATGGYAVLEESELTAMVEIDPNDKPIERKNIRILFFGNGQFALPTLKYLIEQGYDVAAVVTNPDKPCGRGRRLKPTAVKEYAISKGIQVMTPITLRGKVFQKYLKTLDISVGVVVEFRILPESVYTIPAWGTINLHSSLLPQYRGASTIASAIRDGNEVTGVTTFILDRTVDTGDIINNLAVPIEKDENAGDVFNRLRDIGAVMVDDAIQRIGRNCAPVPQSKLICDFIKPGYAPKLDKFDMQIPWWKPTEVVCNFIRSLSPFPTAWTLVKYLDNPDLVSMKIYRATVSDMAMDDRAPGELFVNDDRLLIACADGVLSIEELQTPGRRRITAAEYLNGYRGIRKGFCISSSKDAPLRNDQYDRYAEGQWQNPSKENH